MSINPVEFSKTDTIITANTAGTNPIEQPGKFIVGIDTTNQAVAHQTNCLMV